MTDKLLTSSALSAQAITLQEAEDLENFFDGDDWDDENDMPPAIRKTYEIALKYYHYRLMH